MKNGMMEKVELTPDIWLIATKSVFNLFPAELIAISAGGDLIASITILDDKLKDREHVGTTYKTVGHYWVAGKYTQGGALYSLGTALHVFTEEVIKELEELKDDFQRDLVFATIMELVKTWIESDERGTKKGN